jgi:Ca2+-dependent lipid-binding protein
MDPFVQITTSDGVKYRTRVLQDAGKAPKWNQLLEIPTRITDQVKVTVYDEDIMMDDFVGECMLSVEEVCAMGESKPRWFDLQYEGKKSAEIMLSGHWV